MQEGRKLLEAFEEKKEQWQARAAEGIERYRKGDAKLTFVDESGKPMKNLRVKIKQKSHAFRFGANLFMLGELETEEKNGKYERYFVDVFNMGTLPFYWNTLEQEKGRVRFAKDSEKVYRRPAIDLCMEFCEKHAIEPREHALAYEHFFPDWLSRSSVGEVKRELERRYAEIAARYADKIPTIEVTNEMMWGVGKTAFFAEADYVEYCFKLAEKYFPNNCLCINEWTGACWEGESDAYYAYIRENMEKGARIDAVGMQYHLFYRREKAYEQTRRVLDPENLFNQMDLYAEFGKPLQITEVTVPSYSWEAEDEEIQAELIEALYSVWFSHPNTEQIIYWNLVDGYAYVDDPNPEIIKASQGNMTLGENYYHGGLLRFDLSPKPAYYKIRELLQKRWHTEECLISDEKGEVRFRGFFGDYDVEIEDGDLPKTISLVKNGKNEFTMGK